MIVSIKAEDLFKTSNPKYSYYSNGIKQKFNNYYDSQHLEITLIKKNGNVLTKQSQLFSHQILKKEIAYKLLEKNSAVM